MSQYCYLSYDLDAEPRFMRLQQELGLSGQGAFFEAYKEIRKCGGKAPFDHLLRRLRQLRYPRRKATALLSDYDLFTTDNHGCVRLNINLAQPDAPDRRQLSLFTDEETPEQEEEQP